MRDNRMIKGLKTTDEEAFDHAQFLESLVAMRQKLLELERKCGDDEILRDAVTISVRAYLRQLDALERTCVRSKLGGGE